MKKNGAPSQDSERAQNVEYYNVWDCDPADNLDTSGGDGDGDGIANNDPTDTGENNFCTSKDSTKPYCDPNLKKCEPCSIVNNIGYDAAKTPIENSGKPNPTDCPAGSTAKGWKDDPADPNDQLIIGKCTLLPGATKGGSCSYFSSCTFNTDCSTACCSRESVAITSNPGPGEGTGKCVTPFSAGNPINPYLCRVA
ncbi:MAG: hypothetical protein HY051_00725 [Candidatus Aenigmarchaeota archaeon]|nr:hypothetical protein [Candidatus Aenigmarchaeota archaeon]